MIRIFNRPEWECESLADIELVSSLLVLFSIESGSGGTVPEKGQSNLMKSNFDNTAYNNLRNKSTRHHKIYII